MYSPVPVVYSGSTAGYPYAQIVRIEGLQVEVDTSNTSMSTVPETTQSPRRTRKSTASPAPQVDHSENSSPSTLMHHAPAVARQPRVIHHFPVRKHEKHLQTIALLPAEGERDQPAWTAGDLSPRADHAGKEGRQMSVQFLRLGGAGKGFAGCEVVAVEILVPLAE